MKWLLRRVLLIILALTLVSASVVVIMRLAAAPSTLRQIGFSVCDGDPCFRGIKVGTSWDKAHQMYPNASIDKVFKEFEVPIGIANVRAATIRAAEDQKMIQMILLKPIDEYAFLLQISAGEIVARYGIPCSVFIMPSSNGPPAVVFIYPKLAAIFNVIPSDPYNPAVFRLDPNWSADGFGMTTDNGFGTCADRPSQMWGIWHGFTSTDIYEAHFRRAADAQR